MRRYTVEVAGLAVNQLPFWLGWCDSITTHQFILRKIRVEEAEKCDSLKILIKLLLEFYPLC